MISDPFVPAKCDTSAPSCACVDASFTYDAFDPVQTSHALGLNGLITFCRQFDDAISSGAAELEVSSLLQARWGDGWRTPNWELVFLLMSQGLFRAALRMRRALESQAEQGGSLLDRFSLYVQRGSYDQATRILQQDAFSESLPAGESLDRLAAYLPHAEIEERKQFQTRSPLTLRPDAFIPTLPTKLAERIKGRKIMIKGPARSGARKNRSYDDDLFVVNFNHVDAAPAEGADSHENASHVECSVYSGAVAMLFDAQPNLFEDGRIYRIFKYGSPSSARKALVYSGCGHQAIWSRFSQLRSSPNLLQIALSDFIAHGFAPIAVTDNNLYVRDAYKRGYSSRSVQEHLSPFESRLRFAKHDPFANRDYLIGLYKSGLIEPDEVLGELLSMDDSDFALCMQQEHGGPNSARVLAALRQLMGLEVE